MKYIFENLSKHGKGGFSWGWPEISGCTLFSNSMTDDILIHSVFPVSSCVLSSCSLKVPDEFTRRHHEIKKIYICINIRTT